MKISRRNFLVSLSSMALTAPYLKAEASPLYLNDVGKLDRLGRIDSLCFGSCNQEDEAQPCWGPINNLNPDLFMWLGDNIYADTENMDIMWRKYQRQLAIPGYQRLLRQTPIIGTWDDHDYGANDSGASYRMKEQSRELFFRFMNEPQNSKRRDRPGIYNSHQIGSKHGKVKIILFDLRYNKMDRKAPNADILGEEQWAWFENELATSDADFHLLGSSISVLSSSLATTEDWDKFPASYNRLFSLLNKYNPRGTLFLAGDKHFGCFSSRPSGARGQRYFEMMSSGLTRTVPGFYKPTVRKYYGAHKSFTEINFGHIRFDWNRDVPRLICDIRGRAGQLALRRIFEPDDYTGLLREVPQKGLELLD